MNMFAAFCRAIDDGLFDEVEGAEKNGTERLTVAADPFLVEGTITEEQKQKLLQRLDQRKLKMSRTASA